MKESTKLRKRRQEHARSWAEIVALSQDSTLPKTQIARRVGCCRQTVYNVLARARGLPQGQAPVPRKPGPPPGTGASTPQAALQAVVAYRLEHPARGYHYCHADLKRQGLAPPAAATIGRAWRRSGQLCEAARLERPPTRWTPPRPQSPGHLQLDVKYLPGRRFEYTAIDVYSRYVYARVSPRLDSHTAAAFVAELARCLPFPIRVIQVDGGAEFRREFDALLADWQLDQRRNAPHSPWQNGCVERFHRTVAEECYLALADDLEDIPTQYLDRALQDYLAFYNHQRLHSALHYRPPVEMLHTNPEYVYAALHQRCPTNP